MSIHFTKILSAVKKDSKLVGTSPTCYLVVVLIMCGLISVFMTYFTFGGAIFQQQLGTPMDTNCAPLLAELFLHSYETEFHQNLAKNKNLEGSKSFSCTY